MEDRLPRKLAAILYADVAGYSRLTGEDEDATHRALREYLDLIASTIQSHRGQVMHYAGDAVLAKFDAVVDALSSAVLIQSELETRNEDLPNERKVQFRIGVNLGDVIEDRGDIYGDGVNVAARLESLADEGGICISESVKTAIGKKLPCDYEFMGEQTVKNIAEPVRAYRVLTDTAQTKQQDRSEQADLKLPDKPSIAVLPFTNMSADPEQEYFVDGITEDIITELSRFPDLFVISRNSSFVFKGQSADIADVARRLGVKYVLEGSVRKVGNRVRITGQLVDAATGDHVWADRYDRELEDIFAVQDEAVRTITATLVGRVEQAGRDRAKSKSTSSLEAYECLLQGRGYWNSLAPADNVKAREMFEKAIELDPEYAAASAGLAMVHLQDWAHGWSEAPDASFVRMCENAEKSVALDDADSRTQTALGMAYLIRGEHDQARFHLDRARTLNPSDTHALVQTARYHVLVGEPERAVERVTEACRLNPFGRFGWALGQVYYAAHRYEEAVHALRNVRSPSPLIRAWMAASYAQAGRGTEARQTAKDFVADAERKLADAGAPIPQDWLDFIAQRWRFKQREDLEHLLDGLRKTGLPE